VICPGSSLSANDGAAKRLFRSFIIVSGGAMLASRVLRRMLCLATIAGLMAGVSPAASEVAGRIIGHIDGARYDGDGAHVWGWACQQGRSESIDIHVYNEAAAAAKASLVVAGKADRDSEAAVDRACQDTSGHKHRFDVVVPGLSLVQFHGQKLVVHGIRVTGNVENAAITGSGAFVFPDAPRLRDTPKSYPPLAGAYVSQPQHPRVFISADELADLARRINRAGSFSAARFKALADQVRQDLGSKADWEEAYAGCDMEIYLRAFSFEPKPAYGNDRSEDDLRKAMKMGPGAIPLHGGAVVAARFALYAALAKAGATLPQGAPAPDQAAATAKRILLAWADRGFRDESGRFRGAEAQYCDLGPDGKAHSTQFGTFVGALTLARGVIYSVHAQDLLAGISELKGDEQARLDTFHGRMHDLIRAIHNEEYDLNLKWKYADEVYNNQFVGHLTSLLSIARLLDDRAKVVAVMDGGAGENAVKLPWSMLFDNVIYGLSDQPHLRITPNSSTDPAKSHPAFSTPVVAPGEINDRYRNDNWSQGIGYPMGSLQGLFMQAELLKIAGFDPYGYRGAHGQSIEMATQYYACYAKSAGFRQVVSAENARGCADFQEYVGRVVNGVDANVVIGAFRFPGNALLAGLEAAAKTSASSGPFSLEPILFGKWRD
jgi:hypothetical protein